MEGTEISVSIVGKNGQSCFITFVGEYNYPITNNSSADIVGTSTNTTNGVVFNTTVPSDAKYLILPIVDTNNNN